MDGQQCLRTVCTAIDIIRTFQSVVGLPRWNVTANASATSRIICDHKDCSVVYMIRGSGTDVNEDIPRKIFL